MAKPVTTETDLIKSWQKLEQKVESQNKEISSLLQSMRQERREMRQESEQGQQRLSSAVSRMELRLKKKKNKKEKVKMNITSDFVKAAALLDCIANEITTNKPGVSVVNSSNPCQTHYKYRMRKYSSSSRNSRDIECVAKCDFNPSTRYPLKKHISQRNREREAKANKKNCKRSLTRPWQVPPLRQCSNAQV